MDAQRERARRRAPRAAIADTQRRCSSSCASAPPTRFVGYERLERETSVAAARSLDENGAALVKLEESPFYPEGGGQVSDSGVLPGRAARPRSPTSTASGDDQALVASARTRRGAGEPERDAGRGRGRPRTRHAHDAKPHRHAPASRRASRAAGHPRAPGGLGGAPRQAPLRLHARRSRSAPEEVRDDRGRGQRLGQGQPRRCAPWRWSAPRPRRWARWRCSARSTATGCGWSRSTTSRASSAAARTSPTSAECGIFAIVSEGSSAANVRRIEALTGPAAIDWFRERSAALDAAGALLGSAQDPVRGAPSARRSAWPSSSARSRRPGARRPGRRPRSSPARPRTSAA